MTTTAGPAADTAVESAGDRPSRALSAIIIGAGAGGLCAAIKLQEAGVERITILERADGLGGTWRDNRYPGAACDVPSHLYSFSFAPKKDWTRKFAEQPEILGYFEWLADKFDLRRHIRFGSAVTAARFDDATSQWEVTVVSPSSGATDTMRADVVVCAVGQLSEPSIPDIDGLDTFGGPAFHSARWDDSVDIDGKDVVVVGNGASALQFIPPVASAAKSLTIFQRSANWILPKPDRAYTQRERTILMKVPGAARLHRWWIFSRLELNYGILRQRTGMASLVRKAVARKLQPLVSERLPEAAIVPDYDPGCKRILISNDYYNALLRENVTVELDPIDHIEPGVVVTKSGTRHPADILLFGTGFKTTKFLTPMRVIGRGGRSLNDEWSNGAHAHLGVEIAGFPNFFVTYGPNTNLGHNSILFMIEAQTRYIAQAVRHLIETGAAAVEVRQDVMDRFTSRLHRDSDRTVWATGCSSWYKNEQGVITNNWPLPASAYWWRTRHFLPSEHRTIERTLS